MTATSIDITASVFGKLKRSEGQIVGGGAIFAGPIFNLGYAAVAFVAVALFLSLKAAPSFDWVPDQIKAPGDVVVASFLVLTICYFVVQPIGLEAALGAFAGGLILSSSTHSHAIDVALKPLLASFDTVFFVLIGTGMHLSVLNPLDRANREGLIVAAFLLTVAIAGQLIKLSRCCCDHAPTG